MAHGSEMGAGATLKAIVESQLFLVCHSESSPTKNQIRQITLMTNLVSEVQNSMMVVMLMVPLWDCQEEKNRECMVEKGKSEHAFIMQIRSYSSVLISLTNPFAKS